MPQRVPMQPLSLSIKGPLFCSLFLLLTELLLGFVNSLHLGLAFSVHLFSGSVANLNGSVLLPGFIQVNQHILPLKWHTFPFSAVVLSLEPVGL